MHQWIKLLFAILLLVSTDIFAQCPQNIGVEDGTFNNWQCYAGRVDVAGNVTVSSVEPIAGRHTIISANSYPKLDPFGHFPTLCPNDSKYSIRLGNQDTSAQAERLTYNFKIPQGQQYNLVFNYAVVLQNPSNHSTIQQPRFTVKIYDVTDQKYLDCPAFDFIASPNLPGFKKIPKSIDNKTDIYYKEWSASTINLVGYGGKVIQFQFTTNDCTRGGHFGYAYLDINESCTTPITGNAYCLGQPSVTLYAPPGFYDYYWYNSDLKTQIGHGATLKLSPPPPDNTKYAVIITPYPGLGCADTLYTTVNQINEGFTMKVAPTVYGCPGTGADLTAPAVTAGSINPITFSYHTDPDTLNYVYNPKSVMAGTYYIKGINPEGCMNVLPVHVIIGGPAITVHDPPAIEFPGTVDLSKAFTHDQDLTYSYYTNAAGSSPLSNYNEVSASGTYYIKAISPVGCDTLVPVKVNITPPKPYTIKCPGTFTPNNDGINDHFMLTLNGIVSFVSLSIYDRNGQQVFKSTSVDEYWNGNFKGKPLPTGTYYWVFEGRDDYYHTQTNKASSITLIR